MKKFAKIAAASLVAGGAVFGGATAASADTGYQLPEGSDYQQTLYEYYYAR
ncbi:hypothetical protein JSY14_11290 [Brachybacterium sp. EF45031]|uniref:hypothetical protein n=1 Tax=Brachybacterium sillae TaxID=2810536 RepID=UPI00217CFB54|nr:hypothetical protein [Brachybacterium sillae]MCS6712573.1 hypothetical protein [Brachybacterium sillae]